MKNMLNLKLVISILVISSIVFAKEELFAQKNKKENGLSVLFVIDCSGSMAENNKIEDAKSAARGAISGLSGTFEVGVIAFFDCGSINVLQGFTNSKESAIGAISGLSPDQATPLADAVSYGRQYLMANAKYGSKSLIVLSDGEETCGGNPNESFSDDADEGSGADDIGKKDKDEKKKEDKEYPSGII